jgi:pyruvate kinase
VTLAARGNAEAIVAVTGSQTAGLLSSLRPLVRILAVTPTPGAAARLALTWGVTPVVTSAADLPDLRRDLVGRSLVNAGSVVVFVAIHDALERDDANYVYLERL